MDPIVNDARTNVLREQVAKLAQELHPAISIHDFRITAGPRHTNILFDMVVPYACNLDDDTARREMTRRIQNLSRQYYPVIQIDRSYVELREE